MTSASILTRRSCTIWKLQSGRPNCVRPCVYDDHVRDRPVADPALGPIEHVFVAAPPRRGLEADRVRSVLGFGERERADLLEVRHGWQPALLLLVGAEHCDRLHGESGLDAEEGAEAAVTAVQLHVDEPAGSRAHRRTAVALDAVAGETELAQPLDQGPWKLGTFPIPRDDGQHLAVHEAARLHEARPLLVRELVAYEEVVGGERLADLPGEGRLAHQRSGSASASAIAR